MEGAVEEEDDEDEAEEEEEEEEEADEGEGNVVEGELLLIQFLVFFFVCIFLSLLHYREW